MWKPEHRRTADHHGFRYPSDLTDAEWAVVEPMIPPAKRGGRRREVNVREVSRKLATQFAGHVYLEIFAGLEPRLMQIELAGGLPMHDAT